MFDKLDTEIERFINRRIHSPLDMDILIYFHRSPIMVEGPRRIAKRLGKDVKKVTKSLHRFESYGIFQNMATGGDPLYVYSASDKLHAVIERFVKLTSSHSGREMVDNKLITDGKI